MGHEVRRFAADRTQILPKTQIRALLYKQNALTAGCADRGGNDIFEVVILYPAVCTKYP